jgi:hypothetical protein
LTREESILKLKTILPGIYLAIAAVAWLDFMRLPPDGLANIGLMLVVLPVTLIDLALRPADKPGTFVLMPDGLGYYGDHAVYFFGGVLLVSAGLCLLGGYIDKKREAGSNR